MESASASLCCCSCHCSPLNSRVVYRNPNAHLPRNAKLQCRRFVLNLPPLIINCHARETKQAANRERRKGFQGFTASTDVSESREGEGEEEGGFGVSRISSNMWLRDLRAVLGQRLNVQGLAFAIRVLSKEKALAIPHLRVPDIRYVDWVELKNRGFEGVVFDKDNTITAPYSLALWAPLESTMKNCRSVFGKNLAVFSNSAGLLEYDPDGVKATALEDATGIIVIRHRAKKPAGAADEIERHFGCESSRLIMVGDRLLTDIVYGNRNGFFTILTDPLSKAEEPLVVRQVRFLEMGILNQWSKKGLRPIHHKLVPDPEKCIKDHPI